MEPWRTQSCDVSGGGSNKALMLVHVPVNGCSGRCHRCEAHTCQIWGYRNILTCMRYFLATGQTTFDRLCCVTLPNQIRILIHLMRLMKMMVVTAQLLWHLVSRLLETLPTLQGKESTWHKEPLFEPLATWLSWHCVLEKASHHTSMWFWHAS